MKARSLIAMVVMLVLVLAGGFVLAADTPAKPATPTSTPADSVLVLSADSVHYIVYYFYTNVRCPTCRKLEAYSQEAVDSGFVKAIADGRIEFRGVNTDDEPNAHFLKDYQLFTKSVVVVEYNGDKQLRWKNLEKIWELVGDKAKYLSYVRSEVDAFMADTTK